MQQHLLDRDLACVLHAQSDHGQAIADQDHVHAGSVADASAGKVMRCDHSDRLPFLVKGPQCADCHLLA